MTTYLRVDASGVAVERIEASEPIETLYHADIVAMLHPRGDAEIGWVWKDGAFEAPPPPPPAPPTAIVVSPRQFRLALLDAGLLDDAEALIADTKTSRALKISWEYATEIRSDYPVWPDMIAALGKTRADLDAVLAAAAQIV